MASSTGVGTAPAQSAPMVGATVFQQDFFVARQKIFALAPKFFFFDQQGNVTAFLRKKVFSWKDDIRVFTDETRSFELLRIKGRQVIDFGASFDVTDSFSGQKAGTLKRRGWKSLLRAEWDILDAAGQEIGKIREDSAFRAALRRLLGHIIPQGYTFELAGEQVGIAKHTWNFFVPTVRADFTADPAKHLDRRLVVAAIVLLMTVEKVEERN
ncbi:MAG TPA: hypothetical protein VLT16_05430 [Candidatus Limnocylindrales bacterium]|nr:hypothetical protein [Candidatus Limnocylindrales bacterium]